jgi:hypothetical protein
MELYLLNENEILTDEEVKKHSPEEIQSLLKLSTVNADPTKKLVAFFLKKEEQIVILLLQRQNGKWEIVFPIEMIDINNFFLIKIEDVGRSLSSQDTDFFQHLLDKYSQSPIDVHFLEELGHRKIVLSEDPNIDRMILDLIDLRELITIRYFLPYVQQYLLSRMKMMKDELWNKYNINSDNLNDDELFWLYSHIKDKWDFVIEAVKHGKLNIVKVLMDSKFQKYFKLKTAEEAALSNHQDILEYLISRKVFPGKQILNTIIKKGFLQMANYLLSQNYLIQPKLIDDVIKDGDRNDEVSRWIRLSTREGHYYCCCLSRGC